VNSVREAGSGSLSSRPNKIQKMEKRRNIGASLNAWAMALAPMALPIDPANGFLNSRMQQDKPIVFSAHASLHPKVVNSAFAKK